jgi:hypothetical protein
MNLTEHRNTQMCSFLEELKCKICLSTLIVSCRSTSNDGAQLTLGGFDQKNCGRPVMVNDDDDDSLDFDWKAILHEYALYNTVAPNPKRKNYDKEFYKQ